MKDIGEDDKLFNFMDDLQSWAQAHSRRQGVKVVAQAIAIADALANYKTPFSSSNGQSERKSPLIRTMRRHSSTNGRRN